MAATSDVQPDAMTADESVQPAVPATGAEASDLQRWFDAADETLSLREEIPEPLPPWADTWPWHAQVNVLELRRTVLTYMCVFAARQVAHAFSCRVAPLY